MSDHIKSPKDSREDACPDTTTFAGTDPTSPFIASNTSSGTSPSQVTYSHCTILHIKEAHISITSESITSLHAASQRTPPTTSAAPAATSHTTFHVPSMVPATMSYTFPPPLMTSSGALPIPTITSSSTTAQFREISPPNFDICDFSHVATSTSSLDLLDLLTSQPNSTNPDPSLPHYVPICSPPTPLCDELSLYATASLPASLVYTSATFSLSSIPSTPLQAPRSSALPASSVTTVQSLLDLPAPPVYLTARSNTTRTTTARSSLSTWSTHNLRLGSSRGRPRRYIRSSPLPLLPKVTEHNNHQSHHRR